MPRGSRGGGRKVVDVSPSSSGWTVQTRGSQRPSSTHETKPPAVAAGKESAKAAPLGQVVIRKQDGTIQTEHTYRKDPERHKG